MEIIATHYINLKDKNGKDVLVVKAGQERKITKQLADRLEKEAAGKYKIKGGSDEQSKTK